MAAPRNKPWGPQRPERYDYKKFYEELSAKQKSFEEALSAFADHLVPETVEILTKEVALTIVDRVTAKTPVDTGRARANWNVAIGADPDLVVTENEKRNPVAEGQKVLEHLRPFEAVTISNNVEYIGALERGHSLQAPTGMLGVTLDELRVDFEQG